MGFELMLAKINSLNAMLYNNDIMWGSVCALALGVASLDLSTCYFKSPALLHLNSSQIYQLRIEFSKCKTPIGSLALTFTPWHFLQSLQMFVLSPRKRIQFQIFPHHKVKTYVNLRSTDGCKSVVVLPQSETYVVIM